MKSLDLLLPVILLLNLPDFPQNFVKQSTGGKEVSEVNDAALDITPVIFIPGTMGSPLYDDVNNNNRLTLDEKAWFGPEFLHIRLAENGIDPAGNYNIKVSPLRNDPSNTLRDELNMIPMDLYKGFFDNLEANDYILDNYDSNHNQGENLFCFTYDWRKNNTTTAQLLSDFIDSVKEWTGAAKVNIIGHSMGGTVSKTCINIFDKSRIKNMVFIGAPHLGAPEVLTVMLKGKLFEWLGFYIDEALVRSLARNFPALYQLIPSMNYFNLDLHNNVSTDIEVYNECLQIPNGSYTNYSEMIEYLKIYESSFGEDLNDALIDSSEIFKESISNVDFGNIQVFNIVGYNKLTIGKNRIRVIPPLNIIVIEESRNLNGDYTVPVRSAEIINDHVFENTYYIPNIIHSALPSSQQVLEILLGVFSDPPVTNFPQYSTPPLSYKTIITDVKIDPEIPKFFFLSQNYPNPFNPTTNFEFQLPEFERVSLSVYDLLSNKIATIVDEELPAGAYKYHWNASGLASGVYFYRFQVRSFIETKQMILLK